MASVIKMLAKRQHYEVWKESYECATMLQKLYTGKDHIDWKMLKPPFLPVMTTGKSCFQVIESPCLNVSSLPSRYNATAVSSRMRSYEEKHYILTSKAENEWQLKPRNSISPLIWFLRAHSEGHEWARNGPGMGPEWARNGPGMGPAIIQAASKNPRLRNVKNRYRKVKCP